MSLFVNNPFWDCVTLQVLKSKFGRVGKDLKAVSIRPSAFEAEGHSVRRDAFEARNFGNSALKEGRHVLLDKMGEVQVDVVMQSVEMRLSIEPVLVGIEMVAPYFDKFHQAGQIYSLKQKQYVFNACGFRQPLGNLLYLVLRHELIEFPEVVLAEGN